MRFFTFIFSRFLYIVSIKRKITIYCGLWRTHRESNPELTLRRGLFYPLNYECKLRILRKLVNDMAFSKTLPKTLPIFYSVVKNARYLAFFGLKSPIFAHFCWIHLALRRRTLYPTELQKHLLYQVYIHFFVLSNKKRVFESRF